MPRQKTEAAKRSEADRRKRRREEKQKGEPVKAETPPPPPTPPPEQPPPPVAETPKGEHDATFEELKEFALAKGNTEKAAELFAETNTGNPGYVTINGVTKFSRERFEAGNG